MKEHKAYMGDLRGGMDKSVIRFHTFWLLIQLWLRRLKSLKGLGKVRLKASAAYGDTWTFKRLL